MEHNDGILDLSAFINKIKPHLMNFDASIDGDMFNELIEKINGCQRKGIYFRIYLNHNGVYGIADVKDYMTSDEAIEYLFDMVELKRWKITYITYSPNSIAYRSMKTAYDKVEMWLSDESVSGYPFSGS
jgi:hypothetical protein